MRRFDKLGYHDFKKLAVDCSLSDSEKIGFDQEYRDSIDFLIFKEIMENTGMNDLPPHSRVLDIGAGCTQLPVLLSNCCHAKDCNYYVQDSAEMLGQISFVNMSNVTLISGPFPEVLPKNYMDVVICYSILHHVKIDMDIFHFLDNVMNLLNPGGVLFLGDIPNSSKKEEEWFKTKINDHVITDMDILTILHRYRMHSPRYDTYLVPHNPKHPLAKTREHIVIRRP